MPDLPTPIGDLDERIRHLVASAVADAPAPPEIGGAAVALRDGDGGRNGRNWWIGGTAVALAAAAAVGVIVLTDNGTASITTPNSQPTVQSVQPTTATVPVTAAASTMPDDSSPVSAVAPPSSETAVEPSALDDDSQVVTAGPSGVTVRDGAGNVVRTLGEPMSIGLAAGDGSVVIQRASGRQPGLPDSAIGTAPLLWNADGTLTELWPGADFAGPVTLHDLAIVDGEPLLLYSVATGRTPEDSSEVLYTSSLTGVSETVGEIGGWESGTSRLHLGASGLIVGERYAEASRGLLLLALDGSAADEMVVDIADLGVDEEYVDCNDCPRLYSVAPDRPELVWLDGNDLLKVLLSETGPGEPQRITLPFEATAAADLEVVAGGSVIVSTADAAQPPIWFQPDAEPTTLEGASATKSPDVIDTGSTAEEPSGSTTATTGTPDSPPTTPAALASFVTAGSDGVRVHDGAGGVVRTLEQPAEIAVLTPGGAVIFQPARTDPDGQPGDPLLWKTDGAVERLLGELGERQSYRLHDIAEIDGIPTVLYGMETQGVVTTEPPYSADTEAFTEVLHALRMDPSGWVDTEIDEINTWEDGWGRLSLSDQGLIVGEYSYSVTRELYVNSVPDSPAAGTTVNAATLGVEPEYSECEDCPGDFVVSQDGTTIAWTEGDLVVLHPVGPGEARRWRVLALVERPVRSLDVLPTGTDTAAVIISAATDGGVPDVGGVRVTLAGDGGIAEAPTDSRFAAYGS